MWELLLALFAIVVVGAAVLALTVRARVYRPARAAVAAFGTQVARVETLGKSVWKPSNG